DCVHEQVAKADCECPLYFYSEYNLSRKPLQIDLLIIEKNKNIRIKNQIGHIFRQNNIIEYKSPGDSMSIDDFYKATAYACMYKALGEKVDAVSANELTISMMRESYPAGMIATLKRQGIEIEKMYDGIYYLKNFFIPTQIVVTKELSQGLHNSFRVLSRNVDEKDIETFLKDAEGYIGKSEKSDADAVLQVSMSANYELYEKVRRDNTMCEALRKLMKDEIEEALEAAKQEGSVEGLAEGRVQAQRETSIALAKMGMAVENIATAVNVSIEQVQSWINAKDSASAM
ncbi:MAG: hypothetical protein ACLS55_04065, partial [Lachnospiraceae bacterium]